MLVIMRDGIIRPKKLLDLWPLRKELAYVRVEGGYARIGALTSIAEVGRSELVKDRRYLGFLDAVSNFATPYLRSIATVGGNIGTAHPLSDFAILLLALDAQVKLVSSEGERVVPLEKLYIGKRKLALKKGELLAEVFFKETPTNSSTALMKFDRRWGHSMGYIVTAAYMELEGTRIKDVRIAFDSLGKPFPERARKTEEFLRGKEFSNELLSEAVNEVLPKEMKRISDYRASAEYRLELSKVLLKRALNGIKSRIEGGG